MENSAQKSDHLTIYSGYSNSQNNILKFKIYEINSFENFSFYEPILYNASILFFVQQND